MQTSKKFLILVDDNRRYQILYANTKVLIRIGIFCDDGWYFPRLKEALQSPNWRGMSFNVSDFSVNEDDPNKVFLSSHYLKTEKEEKLYGARIEKVTLLEIVSEIIKVATLRPRREAILIHETAPNIFKAEPIKKPSINYIDILYKTPTNTYQAAMATGGCDFSPYSILIRKPSVSQVIKKAFDEQLSSLTIGETSVEITGDTLQLRDPIYRDPIKINIPYLKRAFTQWEYLMQERPEYIVFWNKENGEFGIADELKEEDFDIC